MSKQRQEILQDLKTQHFDLLVVGGGITGVGIVLDAQTRGLKTALVEMNDFASGTSSRSTKLIHGGLRYLKQWEFKLVNEVGRERSIVHHIAPHLVHPDKMLLPLVKGGEFGPMLTSFGLYVYDWLAGVDDDDKRIMLTKEEAEKMEPLMRTDILEGGGFYAEYRTDDARLVISLARTAASKGACLLNYIKGLGFKYENEKIVALEVEDSIGGEKFEISCTCIVNATGPWVDALRTIDKSLGKKRLLLTKGVHIVVPFEKFPIRQTVYFEHTDKRMIFAVPRGRAVYLGTTDTEYVGDISQPQVKLKDVKYILKAVNTMFPEIDLQVGDVESSWAGIRPLIHEEGKSPSEVSRKDEIFYSKSGLISIAGGKLTGYRKMSERVVDAVQKRIVRSNGKCITTDIQVLGGKFKDYEEVEELIKTLQQKGKDFFSDPFQAKYLVHNYGKDAEAIIKRAGSFDEETSIAIALAEVEFTIENEMVQRALDFFERRTGRVNFHIESIQRVKQAVLDFMQEKLNWSEKRRREEEEQLEEVLQSVISFS